ncbi:hypothetical protein [Flavobacterium hungaricum]|uniref:Uncharacterized protein n=1 Tax=Flavobacterium hungaricum TaxID=2082725 RepID=A0ABR9TH40_9FLAO|nr:hypothetical protein [Flavobacterium hungaricum]MBE8724681.1 hypothetical protein [Flavobacterium hungaricum]
MPSYNFDQDTPEKTLKELIAQYDDFLNDYASSTKAKNLAEKSWHLIDWVFNHFSTIHNLDLQNRHSIGVFRETLYPLCNSLKIMHDIANSSKHSKVDNPKGGMQEARLHIGDFHTSDWCKEDFNVSRLEIILEDGTKLYFEDEIKKVVDFWKSYFVNQLNITL